MKKTLLKIIFTILMLLANGSVLVLADGPGIPPICYPGEPCN